MDDKLSSALVKKAAIVHGADLCTIGSIDRWKDVPVDENPLSIMPNAKSVICIAFRMERGAIRGMMEGTYFSAYSLGNFYELNKIVAPMVQRRIVSFLEDYGYESVPVMYYSHSLGKNMGAPAIDVNGQEKPAPEIFFNFRVGAVLAGMGEIGHSRMLLTKEFGPAQRVYFIITEAEWEPDPIVTGICDGCMACVRECPAHALCNDNNDNIEVPGVTTIKRSQINELRCRIAHNSGAFSPYAPKEIREYAENICNGQDGKCVDGSPVPAISEAVEMITKKVSYANNMKTNFGAPSALCGYGCVIACLKHLDHKGTLSRRFNHKF